MAIIVNGVNIPTNGDYIKVGDTIVDKVICNGVVVWEKQTTITCTPGSTGGETSGNDWTFRWSGWGIGYSNETGTSSSLMWYIDLTNIKTITASCWDWGADAAGYEYGTVEAYIRVGSRSSDKMRVSGYTEVDEEEGEIENWTIRNSTISLDVRSLTGYQTVEFYRIVETGDCANFNGHLTLSQIVFSTE